MSSFVHPLDVPIPEALAIHAIMHSTAHVDDWERLDAWARKIGIDAVVDAVVEVLRLNGTPDDLLPRERVWCGNQMRSVN